MTGVAHAAPASAGPRSRESWQTSFIDVTRHGAEGDGEADDTAAIQRAIDSAPEGAIVVFPPGTYRVSATIHPRVNQTLLGLFPASVIMSMDDVAAFTIFSTERAHSATSTHDADGPSGSVTFDGLVVDLNRDGTTPPAHNPDEDALGAYIGVGIYYIGNGEGGTGNAIRNCEIRNSWQTGIVLQRPDTTPELDLDIVDSTVRNCSAGIMLFQSTRSSVIDTVVESNKREQSTSSNGIVIVHAGDVLVQGVRSVRNGRHGVLVKNSWGFRVIGCTLTGNGTLPNANGDLYGWGITVGRSRNLNFEEHDNSTDFVIANNTCALNHRGGITVDPTKHDENWLPQETGAVITGNVCAGAPGIGIHGIQLNRVLGATVTGNSCHDMPYSGIQVTRSRECVVVGNHCSDNSRYGINVPSVAAEVSYGNHVIGPNFYAGNARGELNVVKTNQKGVTVLEPQVRVELPAAAMGFFGAQPAGQPDPYTVAGLTEERTYDVEETNVAELANVVGTLIADLRSLGLLA